MRKRVVVPALAVVVVLVALRVLAEGGGPASDGLKPGDTLDSNTWQKAENILPPEVLVPVRRPSS